jgi:peptidoglycan/LPS O-acetylase OafA/YrhL
MNPGFSLYLDLVRFLAAFEVFLFHLSALGVAHVPAPFASYGHEAVVVFFVLSGYVISYAASQRDGDLAGYFVARFTRVFSVTVPAVLLTIVFDKIGTYLDPSVYTQWAGLDRFWPRLLISLALLNENWVSIQVFSNTPYWSISYEFWYYFLFAGAFFFRGLARTLLLTGFALVAGPKILLLFPIWVAGSWAYFERRSAAWPCLVHWILFLLPLPFLWLYTHASLIQAMSALLKNLLGYQVWREGLSWSRFVLSDTVLGIVVALHFLGAKNLGAILAPPLLRVKRLLRLLAGYTFTLYLLHQPTILIVAAVAGAHRRQPGVPLAIAAGVIVVVAAIGALTENHRYQLQPLARWIYSVLVRLSSRCSPATGVSFVSRTKQS